MIDGKMGRQVLASILGDKQDRLYAVVDCARSRALFPLLMAKFPKKECLYAGEKARSLASVAPYLLEYESADHEAWQFLFAKLWGTSSLLCIDGRQNINATRQHLKSLALVEIPAAGGHFVTAYFRYYDPRVWCDFIQIATPVQLDACFDDCITSTYAETAQGAIDATLTRVRREERQGIDALLNVNQYSAQQIVVHGNDAKQTDYA